jgi:hypothetical protein
MGRGADFLPCLGNPCGDLPSDTAGCEAPHDCQGIAGLLCAPMSFVVMEEVYSIAPDGAGTGACTPFAEAIVRRRPEGRAQLRQGAGGRIRRSRLPCRRGSDARQTLPQMWSSRHYRAGERITMTPTLL